MLKMLKMGCTLKRDTSNTYTYILQRLREEVYNAEAKLDDHPTSCFVRCAVVVKMYLDVQLSQDIDESV